jgi:hypothetical protein
MFSSRVWVTCLALLVVTSGCKKKTSDVVETAVDAQVAP